ncbi:hypothetical protein [Microbacterium sp. P02]
MDAITGSHLVLAVVAAITAVGGVGLVLAFWSMGRSGYRGD